MYVLPYSISLIGGGNTQQVEKAWNPILVYVNNDVGIQTMPAIINA